MIADLVLELEELIYYDIKTGNITVDKDVFDDYVPDTYINIQFCDSTYPDEILMYVMNNETDVGIEMEYIGPTEEGD